MILSGSWRRMERSPRAKVSPFFSFTGICVMPRSWYSTGSSMVTILSSSVLISFTAAYSVVVLPEASSFFGRKANDVQSEALKFLGKRFLVEHAQDGIFAVARRHDRDAQVDEAPLILHAKTPVLRNSALGNVQIAQHLDARKHRGMPFLG